MNRRGFLRSAVSAAVGVALAPIAAKLLPNRQPLTITELPSLPVKIWSRQQWQRERDELFEKHMLGPKTNAAALERIRFDPYNYGVIQIDIVA